MKWVIKHRSVCQEHTKLFLPSATGMLFFSGFNYFLYKMGTICTVLYNPFLRFIFALSSEEVKSSTSSERKLKHKLPIFHFNTIYKIYTARIQSHCGS